MRPLVCTHGGLFIRDMGAGRHSHGAKSSGVVIQHDPLSGICSYSSTATWLPL